MKLLGITIDSDLKFTNHAKSLRRKTIKKVTAFSRVARLLDLKKARSLYNTFIMSNLNYCSLIWMLCGKTANNEINNIHKRALRIIFNDYEASFEELLHRNKEQPVHIKNPHRFPIKGVDHHKSKNPCFISELDCFCQNH